MKTGNLRWLWLSVIVLIADQMTKYSVVHNLSLGETKPIVPFLNLTLAFNQGAAFSFLNQAGGWQQWFFTGIAVVICVVLLCWLARMPRNHQWIACAAALIFGGALGNLFDRVYHHYVIDFIDFHIGAWHYPTFNVADSAVVVGVMMLLLDMLMRKRNP